MLTVARIKGHIVRPEMGERLQAPVKTTEGAENDFALFENSLGKILPAVSRHVIVHRFIWPHGMR